MHKLRLYHRMPHRCMRKTGKRTDIAHYCSPADKLRHKRRFGIHADLHRSAHLFDAPLIRDYNLIGYFDGFLLIVRHNNTGDAQT